MITSLDEVTEYPLSWPDNKARCAKRTAGNPYGWSATLANGDDAELRRLNLAIEAARKEFGA